jgi:ribosomal protein S5
MAGDLESQLRASLPGRETEVVDFAALVVARERVQQAIQLIRQARPAIAVILGNDRAAVEFCSAADIEASKAVIDVDRAIKNHPAGKAGR